MKMDNDTVSILDGNRFAVSDARGDMDANPLRNHGFFANDTRFLSRWILTVDGQRPAPLSRDDLAYYKVQFFLAATSGTIYVDSKLSVVRQRSIAGDLWERITLMNHGKESLEVEVRLEADADFCDLFEVKDKLDKKGERYQQRADRTLTFGYRRARYHRETRIVADRDARVEDDGFVFKVRVAAHSEWTASFRISHLALPISRERELELAHSTDPREHEQRQERNVHDWIRAAPRLESSMPSLNRTYARSLVDLAALRFEHPLAGGALPAAGLPWFMAVFGRDSLITSFQALPFFPELAASSLRALALFQGQTMDDFRDEEPGKILHELRLGEMTAFEERPHSPYYGAADSTCLFLILLEEYERWTGDRGLVRALEIPVRDAVEWIDRYGDGDSDGYIEYARRNAETGLENQCWKDSWDSIAFSDGTLASLPRATCELQGYAYDAKRRTARLARLVYGDTAWAERLEREAAELKRRFNSDFWIADREFFALALDGDKRRVDSLTSNIGHLLWSGIVDRDKAGSIARHLMSDALFSGWGVRTMAQGEGSYNPIGYHVGTVWPHDNSIIAWGLRQYGFREEAARIAQGILEAADFFQNRLPEAFAGYARETTRYPVEYPTACSPQAWATAAPLLLLRTLLGLESDGRHLLIEPALPASFGRVELLDLRGPWGITDAFGRGRDVYTYSAAAE
ncbi:MAG TPA: glycogen debranching N-terminal domain-containing protein [Polyangiaceae bacterium]